jgi:hypothetical protein
MKRIALAFAAFTMLTAGSLAILSAAPMGAAKASALSRQAAHGGPYASATEPRGNAAERVPAPSIPYDADGPAYVAGHAGTTDFQLQH